MEKTINALSGLSCLLLMFLWSSMPAIGRQHEFQSHDANKRITLFAFASEEKSNRDDLAADLHFFDQPSRIKQYRQVQINNQLKQAQGVQINDTLTLNLFSGMQVEAWVKRVESNVNGSVVVTASLIEQPGFIVLSTTGSRTLGSLFIVGSDRFFNIISDPVTFDHYLIDVDADHHITEQHAPPIAPPLNTFDTVAQNRIHSTLAEKSLGPDDPATITVMIVYTEDASGWATESGGGVENVIALSMAIAQEVIDNSEVGVIMKLVHSAQVDYVETGITLVDLARFAASPEIPSNEEYIMGHYIPGYMDEIHQWRNEHKADLCALFTLTGSGAMGYLLNTSNGLPGRAFSRSPIQVVATGYTHIHELGHNMGCNHNVDHPNSPGPTDWLNWPHNTWSAAWRWRNAEDIGFCSVMSGPFPDDEPVWMTPFFSNPSVLHQGVPTGHPEWADNARTLREIKHIIAAYRSSPLSNEADSLALVALYHSTGGPNWTNNDNWLEGPLNTWYGLTFEVFLRFIDLNDNNLTGTIPPEIGNLTSLERLYLNRNNLTGNLPTEIGNLNRLIDLNLSFNQLSGPIPTQIGTMNSLKMLRLQNNRLSGPIPPEIGNLSFLVWLALSRNQLSGSIPPEFGNLTRLEGMSLDQNTLSGPIPEEIGYLKKLNVLNLSGNAFGGTIPESFKTLNRLRFLYLGQCLLEGIIPLEFCFFDELMGIYLDDNFFDLKSCAVASCLKAKGKILGTGLQHNGFNLINDCPTQYKVSLTVEPEGEGTLEGEGFYTPGDEVTICVIPSTFYQFGYWSGDSVYLSDPDASEASFVMPENDIELIAQLIINTYTIKAIHGAGGTITPTGTITLNHGDSQSYSIIPDEGYHITDVLVDGVSVGAVASYTFNDIESNHTIEAGFETEDTSVPENRLVQDVTLQSGESDCLDATQAITLAGEGTTFVVEPGASVTLVAGNNIRMLPGVMIVEGGYVHAAVLPGGPFCPQPEKNFPVASIWSQTDPGIIETEVRPAEEEGLQLLAYPNPTHGSVTIEVNGFGGETKAVVQVIGIRGELVLQEYFYFGQQHVLDLEGYPQGVYLIRVLGGNKGAVQQIIKTAD